MRSWTLDAGLPLRVLELSEGGGADELPVVCLHGWLDQAAAWSGVARGRPGRWLGLDQRGHGQSGHVGQGGYYHFPDYTRDLDRLVGALGGRVRLVGHSMGGTVACMYAGARPEAVERLVIVEGLGALEQSDPSYLSRLRQHLDQTRSPPAPLRLKSPEQAASKLLQRNPGLDPDHARLLVEHGTVTDERGLRWSFDPLHLTRAPYPFREELFGEFLREIAAPTLIVWAEQSWYPAEIQARRAAMIREARQVVLPGGHMLPYTSPERLGEVIEGFLWREERQG